MAAKIGLECGKRTKLLERGSKERDHEGRPKKKHLGGKGDSGKQGGKARDRNVICYLFYCHSKHLMLPSRIVKASPVLIEMKGQSQSFKICGISCSIVTLIKIIIKW
jgi:hypothetical protein